MSYDYWIGSTISHTEPGQWGWPQSKPRAVIFLFLLAEVLLIGACVYRAHSLRGDLSWLTGIVLTFSLVYCATHVQIRFRTPIEGLLATLIATALAQAIDFHARKGAILSSRTDDG